MKSKITRAMEYLDDDLIAGAAQEKAVPPANRERKPFFSRRAWTRVAAAAAALVLLATGGIVAASIGGNSNGLTVVAFDVNPSLEIELNDRKEVVKVSALNEDAKIVVEGMNFEGVSLDETVDALIGSMLKHGYLSVEQNSILISVNANDNGQSDTLRRDLSNSVSALLSGSNVEASVITQRFDGKSGQSGVSSAKAALIKKIVSSGLVRSNGSKYTYDQLVNLRVHELKLMLESKGFSASGIELSGKASESQYIGEDRALQIAFEDAGVSATAAKEVEVEFEFDDDENVMCYEVEFVYNRMEYEYELNAVTGAILEKEWEED